MTTTASTHSGRAQAMVAQVNEHAGDDPIRIGIITPLCEPGDPTAGELVVRGACLGAQYVRENGGMRGGRQIEFVAAHDAPAPERRLGDAWRGGRARRHAACDR